MIRSLVDQLDQESALEDQPLLQVYSLDQPLDATVLATLTGMLPGARLTLAADGRQLTVVARVVDHTVVKRLVEQWRQIAGERGEAELKIHPLRYPLAATELATFQALVPGAQVTLAADSRQLRVVARTEDQDKVAALITQLEQAVELEEKPQLMVYPLRRPLSPNVLTTFTTLVPNAQVSVSADTRTLIAVARAADQAVIKKTLDQMEVSADRARDLRLEVYQVDGVSAAQLQTLLQPLVVESTITLDTPQDRLIIWGPADEHLAFGGVVAKLVADPLSGTKPVLMYYPLPDESMSTSVTSARPRWPPRPK